MCMDDFIRNNRRERIVVVLLTGCTATPSNKHKAKWSEAKNSPKNMHCSATLHRHSESYAKMEVKQQPSKQQQQRRRREATMKTKYQKQSSLQFALLWSDTSHYNSDAPKQKKRHLAITKKKIHRKDAAAKLNVSLSFVKKEILIGCVQFSCSEFLVVWHFAQSTLNRSPFGFNLNFVDKRKIWK